MPKQQPLQPLDQPPDLLALMPLCGVLDFNGSLGAVHLCPMCEGRPHEPSPVPFGCAGIETLRIHFNIHNEVVVRCHNCGLAGTALELLRFHTKLPWDTIVEMLQAAHVFGGGPLPDGWIARAKDWERFSTMFGKARAWFRRLARNGQIEEVPFGEVGMSSSQELERILPGVRLISKWGNATMFHVELRRSIQGLPIRVLVRHHKRRRAVASYDFQPPEPLHLMVPEWAVFRDWSEELTVFSDPVVASELHQMIDRHQYGITPPIAWVADCRGPVIDEMPFRRVRYLQAENEGPELALAFVQPGVEVLVRTEEAVKCVAAHIINRTRDADPIAYLHAVLQKPWIAPATAKRLSEAVAARLGPRAGSAIARSGASDRVLPCTIRGTTYLCRNGIYVKKQGKTDWRPCSNFSVRIEESLLMENGQVAHRVLLQMAWRTADFTISSREMDDGRLLLDKLEAVAIQQGFPDLPQVPDPTDLRRLPQVIRTTQLKIKAPMRVACRPEFGFVGGRFHGPDFSTTAHSVSFHSIGRSRAEFPVPWMRPEEFWGNPDDHLVCRANELATWLEALEPPAGRMASIMLCAALNWLHRASRGLPSYLLLLSETHLEFLGRLTGLIPIEVGRGPQEHLGTPRLMRSSYRRPDQFQRHGRIVAALPPIILALATAFLAVKLIQRHRASRRPNRRQDFDHYS